MKLTMNECLRAGRWLGLSVILLLTAVIVLAETVSTTTVQGTVYLANGRPGSGTLLVSWPAFTTANNLAVTAGNLNVPIGADGFVSVNLAPNLGSTPAGLYYTAIYQMSDGTVNTEYWVIPAAAQVAIGLVKAKVMPAAQAVQAVTKAYVDQALAQLQGGQLTQSGGTLTGPLYLNGDPTTATQAADKHYVDTTFSQAVPLSGGTMSGALVTPAVNGVRSPVVGGTQNTLQSTVSAANGNGAVIIPPTYTGTDSFSNPNGIHVEDLRLGVSEKFERSVKEFGAVCDGVTDDTTALQSALDYAHAHHVALTIPQGSCKTHSLAWRGESIGGAGKQVSALIGFPGQDVLSAAADGSVLPNTRLHDLTIYVDQSQDISCTPANGRNPAGSCGVHRLLEPNSIFSAGGNGLNGTAGTGTGWAVGNCAIAMPAVTGAGGNGLVSAEIDNVMIASIGTDPLGIYTGAHSTHTCGLYLAQWPQSSDFRNIDIRGVNTGIAIGLPVNGIPVGVTADSNHWENLSIEATHGFISVAGDNNIIDLLTVHAGNSSAMGEAPTGLILDFAGVQEGWTVRNVTVTPVWNFVLPKLSIAASGGAITGVTVGPEHGLGFTPYGTQLPVLLSGSCTARATANIGADGSIANVAVTTGGTGCSSTTTAIVSAPGAMDTAACVNLISGQNMTFVGGSLQNGVGGYTVWNATGSSLTGTQLSGGGVQASGTTYPALVINDGLGTANGTNYTGSGNQFVQAGVTGGVVDHGLGNSIVQLNGVGSGWSGLEPARVPSNTISADFALFGGGSVSQSFTSLNDLFLSAEDLLWTGGETAGTGSQYGKDASAPVTGSYVKAINGAWNSSSAWHVRGAVNSLILGSGFPTGTGTWYVAAKSDVATNQELMLTGTTGAGAVCTFADHSVPLTTNWQVFSIPYNTVTGNTNCDAGTQGHAVNAQGIAPSLTTNIETAWMSFVPAFQSLLVTQAPTQSNQVANKAYVDQAVSNQIVSGSGLLPIAGGTMTGALNAPVINGTTDCALAPSLPSCIATAQSALIPPLTSGQYLQNASIPATATCIYDTTQGGKITQVTPGSLGYGYAAIPLVTWSGGGGSGLSVTANITGGQVTSYTVANGGSGFTGCPAISVGTPAVGAAPIPILDQRRGVTTYSPSVRVDDFGCAGNGVTDDTLCINSAIAYATSDGVTPGSITFTNGRSYAVTQVTGYMATASDDGTAPASGDTCVKSNAANGIGGSACVPLSPEIPGQLGYAIRVPNGLTIFGNGATIVSNFSATATTFSLAPPYIAMFASDAQISALTVNDLNINNAFIGFASPGEASGWLIRNVTTHAVGVSLLANVLQLSTLRDIRFNSMAGIVVGGWWQCRSSNYNCVSHGDFADAVFIDGYQYFGWAPSVPVGGVVANQNGLDTWFDTYFFHHTDNGTRMTDSQYGSLGLDTDSYWRGIYGIGIAYYSRYGRGSNGDVIRNYTDKVSMSYPIVITNPVNVVIDTMSGEDVGECLYTNYTAWGTSGVCPNPYDSLNNQMQAAILFQRPSHVMIRNVEAPGIDAEAVVGLSWRQSAASNTANLRNNVAVENSYVSSRYAANNPQPATGRTISWFSGGQTSNGSADSGEACYWGATNYGPGVDYDPWCMRGASSAYTGNAANQRYFVFENDYTGRNLTGPVGVQMPGLRVRPGKISGTDVTLPVSDFASQAFSVASGTVPGSSCATVSGIALPGASAADGVLYVQSPTVVAPLQLTGAITAANTMLLSICNPTTSSLNYPTGVYTAFLLDGAVPATPPSTSGGAPVSSPTLTTAVGDLVTAGSGGGPTQLPGNTYPQTAVLTETGTGTSAMPPVWSVAPAFSGANLTGMNAANVTTGVLSVLNGGTGGNSSSQALTNLGGVSLNASSVNFAGRVTGLEVGGVYQADQLSGTDFGARVSACVALFNGSTGGVCDARGFTGALTMGSDLVLSVPNTVIYLPCASITTSSEIVIPAGVRNVTLHGCSLRGTSASSGSQGGTVINYSGAGAAVAVGDPTYNSDTMGFRLDNVAINTTGSASGSTTGFSAYRTQELHLESLYFLGNSNQTGMTLDGTRNYTGGTFSDLAFNGFQTAVNGFGHQVNNAAPTDWLNASTFTRLHINCPTSEGSPVSGTYGINLQQGDGNTITGGDVEGCATALHLGVNAQNNTILGLRNENSTNQVVADVGSSYNSWVSGGTMFTGALTDNGTRNSFLDSFHRSFNGLNGDWYGSQKDATVTNHFRLGIGLGNERGLLNRYQGDAGYRWTIGLSDATAGEQFYQVLDELNSVYRLSMGQYNVGTSGTNEQTVINAAGTGALVLNGSNNAGTGGVVFGSGGGTATTVATIDGGGNANFTGTLQVSGPSTFAGSTTVKNGANAEIDSTLWAGSTSSQKESYIYKDWNGASQWYLVKDASNNWGVNSALSGIDSFKAYQSTNSGDTYVNANASGSVRINYEAGSGTGFNVYSGGSTPSLIAAFTGGTSIRFPGLGTSGGYNCLQIDNSGYVTNTGTACGAGGTGSSFATLGTGTNTSGTMTVGSGGTLTFSGSGVNNANQLNGSTVPLGANVLGSNGSGQMMAAATTGTGNVVLSGSATLVSPTLVTPALGTATATSLSATAVTAGSVSTTGNSTFGGSGNVFNNSAAMENDVAVQSGAGAPANAAFQWNNYTGTAQWRWKMDSANYLHLSDVVNSLDRAVIYQNGNTVLNAGAGSNAVTVNNSSGSGTGGFIVYEGGANNNTAAFTVGGTGNTTVLGTLTEQGTGTSTFAGAVTHSASGAASVSPLALTGSVYSGGTGTTTFPSLFMQPSGATAETSWNTNGTGLGFNFSNGFTGNTIDVHVNGGPSNWSLSGSGAVTAANAMAITTNNTAGIALTGNTYFQLTQTAAQNYSYYARNTTAATAANCYFPGPIGFGGSYWTGAATAANTISLTPSCAPGTNGAETLTIGNSGSTGLFTVAHNGEVTATAFGGTGTAALVAGAAAGTGPTIACEGSHVCSGSNGTIDLTTGTGATTGILLTITAPGVAHANLPDCMAHLVLAASPYTNPLNDAYKFTYTTSVWTLNVGTALAASTAYRITYSCLGN